MARPEGILDVRCQVSDKSLFGLDGVRVIRKHAHDHPSRLRVVIVAHNTATATDSKSYCQ